MKRIESSEVYHSDPAINKSRLFNISVSPEWFKYCEDHPSNETESLVFGRAFHKYVLEQDDFDKEFATIPLFDRRRKGGKELYEQFVCENAEKTIITEDQYLTIIGMKESIMRNKYARALLQGEKEASYYFVDDITGIDCKVRPDCIRELKDRIIITDLKSCTSAQTEVFRKDCVNYGYDLQAAMYKTAIEKEYAKPVDFVFIAVEKKPPYMINLLQADELFLARGYSIFREYIGIYKECLENGDWYGYNGFSGFINNLALPAYLLRDLIRSDEPGG